jgi:capsular polysaccharide transport system permease protein
VNDLIDLRAHYSDRSKDIYSRLWARPTKEELLTYWQWIVSPTFDPDKGIISVEVKAYTPEMAKRINDAILACSEELINQMNDRAHQDAIRLTRAEVVMAQQRLEKAQAALQRFRDDKSVLDPKSTAAGLEGVVAKLEAEAAGVEAELSAALRMLREDSPRVITIRTRLQALRDQLTAEKSRLAGLTAEGSALSSLVGDYTHLTTEVEFAQQQLIKSMAALEGARLKAIAQSRYLVPFQPPTLPEESLYPRPFLFTFFSFLALLIALGIVSLIIAAIKDHMGV